MNTHLGKIWLEYKKANYENWIYEVGDRPPIESLMAHKYASMKVGYVMAMKEAIRIARETRIAGHYPTVEEAMAVKIAKEIEKCLKGQ